MEDRNNVEGFADRVIKNLRHTTSSFAKGDDVHMTTALINSLLGLVIFPVEYLKDSPSWKFPDTPLENTKPSGEVIWHFTLGHSITLKNHMFHIRNALSHRRVRFSSDSRYMNDVIVYFADKRPKETEEYWRSYILASDLYDFTISIPNLIKKGHSI